MRVVHKFVFETSPTLDIILDVKAAIVLTGIDWSSGRPAIWIERSAEWETAIKSPACFKIYGTGQRDIPDYAIHVGSIIQSPYVWHVYRIS